MCVQDRRSRSAEAYRHDWVRDALRSAAGAFAVDVLAYAVMSNHLHLVVRTNPVRVADWSAETVARRWAAAHPPTTTLDPNRSGRVRLRRHTGLILLRPLQFTADRLDNSWITAR